MTAIVGSAPPTVLQFFDNRGNPAANGTVLTQVGGVNYATYQDAGGATPLPNPIPLNSRGEVSNASGVSCQLFLVSGVIYTFTLYDSAGNQLNQATSVKTPDDLGVLAASSGSSLVGFLQSGTGAVARTLQSKNRDIVSIEDFGAIGNGINDDAVQLNLAISSGAKHIVLPYPPTVWRFNTTVNVTDSTAGTRTAGLKIECLSSNEASSYPPIDVHINALPVFDCTGSSSLTFENVAIRNPVGSGLTPSTGWLLARNSTNASAGTHRFVNARAWGQFTYGCVYNYGSEELDWISCWMNNVLAGGSTQVLTANNINSLTSAFATIATGLQSTTVHRYLGGSYLEFAEGSTSPGSGNYTEQAFYLDQVSDVGCFGTFFDVPYGKSAITVDATNGGSNNICVHGCRQEAFVSTVGHGNANTFLVVSGGAPGSTGLTGYTHIGGQVNCDVALIQCASDMVMANITTSGIASGGHSIAGVFGTLNDSRIDTLSPINIQGDGARNVLYGDHSQITISGASTLNSYVDVGVAVWTPTVTSSAGTITTATNVVCRCTRNGREVTIDFSVITTTNGTGSGYIIIAGLPIAIDSTANGTGVETATGKSLAVSYQGANSLKVTFYDGTYPGADGHTLNGTVVFVPS